MIQYDTNRYCFIRARERYTNYRNVKILFSNTDNRQIHINYNDLKFSNRKATIYIPEQFFSNRNVTISSFMYEYFNKLDIFILVASFIPDDRHINCRISSQTQLHSYKIKLPVLKISDVGIYLANYNFDQRYIHLNFIDSIYLKKYLYLCRSIGININDYNLLLPIVKTNEIQGIVYSNPVDERNIKILLTADTNKYMFVSSSIFKSVNSFQTTLSIESYNTRHININVYKPTDNRNVLCQNNTYTLLRFGKVFPTIVFNNEKDIYIDIKRTHSISETKVFWSWLKWNDRMIYIPWILYHSDRNIFQNIGIFKFTEDVYKSRIPLDIAGNIDDVAHILSSFTSAQIDSIVIYDEDGNYVAFGSEELGQPDKRHYKLKLSRLFKDNKKIKIIHFEIFNVFGTQYTGTENKRKIVYSAKIKGTYL